MCTGKLNTGTLRETVRERVASPGRRLREFVQVHRCTMSKQSGDGWPRQGGLCGECVRYTRRYTMRNYGSTRRYAMRKQSDMLS